MVKGRYFFDSFKKRYPKKPQEVLSIPNYSEIINANQELNIWLKYYNLMHLPRLLKPTAIDIYDHRINCRLL